MPVPDPSRSGSVRVGDQNQCKKWHTTIETMATLLLARPVTVSRRYRLGFK